MNRKRLEKVLEKDEGRKHKAYDCNGVMHIGIGHNILGRELADETLDVLGIEDEEDLLDIELTDDQIDYLFNKDVDIAVQDLEKVFDATFDKLSDVRQEVLVNMMFNLGLPRFRRFKKLITAVIAQDFNMAAEQILDSRAARQLPDRYNMLADAMRDSDPIKFGPEFLAGPDGVSMTGGTRGTNMEEVDMDPHSLMYFTTLQLLEELTRREKEALGNGGE